MRSMRGTFDGLFQGSARRASCCARNFSTSARCAKWTKSRVRPSGDAAWKRRKFPRVRSLFAQRRDQIQDWQRASRQSDGKRFAQTDVAFAKAGARAWRVAGRRDRRRLFRVAVQDGSGRWPGEPRHHGANPANVRVVVDPKSALFVSGSVLITARICKRAASRSPTRTRSRIVPAARVSRHDRLLRAPR